MTNLKNFTFDELYSLQEFLYTLTEEEDNLPKNFSRSGMVIKYDDWTNECYLTNSRKQIIKVQGDCFLGMWYTLENSDIEGFFEDLVEAYYEGSVEDIEDLKELYKIAKIEDCKKDVYGDDCYDLTDLFLNLEADLNIKETDL